MEYRTPNPILIDQLRREVQDLEERKTPEAEKPVQIGLGPIEQAFRNQVFPKGTIHELSYQHPDQSAASLGFMAGILGKLMQAGGYCLWVTGRQAVFPLGLSRFGLTPERVFFLRAQDQKQATWAIEEALKCSALVAVVGELSALSFAASRRLQLAVEHSGVTGFVYWASSSQQNSLACSCRWRVQALPGFSYGAPGLGLPRWQVELTKARTGTPSQWDLEWAEQSFRYTAALAYWNTPLSQTQVS